MEYTLYTLEHMKSTVALSECEFRGLIRAFELSKYLYELEIAFDHVVENYYEVEIAQLQTATRYMMDASYDPEWTYYEFLKNARQLMNFLSTAMSYKEQRRKIAIILSAGEEAKLKELRHFRESLEKEYLSFRFMEKLRNHAQHFHPPMRSMIVSHSRVDDDEGQDLQTTLSPFVDVQDLKDDPEFPNYLIDEAKPIKGKIYINPHLKVYMSCLGKIQDAFREHFKDQQDFVVKTQTDAREKYFSHYECEDDLIFMVSSFDGDTYPETRYFPARADKHRERLREKNRRLSNIDRQFVTTRLKRKNN